MPSATRDVAHAATEVGQVFAQGKTDGLILYALVLISFFLFLALILVIWSNSRERRACSEDSRQQAVAFAAASKETAEALKDLATAIASTGSAETAFKQVLSPVLSRVEMLLTILQHREGVGE